MANNKNGKSFDLRSPKFRLRCPYTISLLHKYTFCGSFSAGVQPGQMLSPVSQANMMVAGAPHPQSSVGFMPSIQQQMMYANPQYVR